MANKKRIMSIGQEVFKLKMHTYKYTFNFHVYTIIYKYT